VGFDQGGEVKDSKKRRGEAASCKMGQLTCSMGLEQMGICICASNSTTPSKGICVLRAYILNLYILEFGNTVLIMYIFLLCRLK
jgi:hypothetical protein